MKEIVIGSRGSRLALWQARHVMSEIGKAHPGTVVRLEIIKTTGDKMTEVALAKIGGKGVFVKEIEEALLEGRIDLAVHSLKDVPTELPEGLELAAVLAREDARDVLVADQRYRSIDDFPANAKVGTGSLRRSVQLRHLRPDLVIHPLRGNVDTRLRKLRDEALDGIVLAAAGLKRLGYASRVAYTFPVSEMTPAIGQGALAIEIRSDHREARHTIAALNHVDSRLCADQEREFLLAMGGGCQVPMGAHAMIENGDACFLAFVAGPNSGRLVRHSARGPAVELAGLRERVTERLLADGAQALLDELD